MKTQNIIIYIAAAFLAFLFLSHVSKKGARREAEEYLNSIMGVSMDYLSRMTDKEVIASASYIRDYTQKGKTVEPGSELDTILKTVSMKYKLFNYK